MIHNISYDLINNFNRQHLISMGQMSPVVHNYEQALYDPKYDPFKPKNTNMEKASFIVILGTLIQKKETRCFCVLVMEHCGCSETVLLWLSNVAH